MKESTDTRIALVILFWLHTIRTNVASQETVTGADIGYSCTQDVQCTTGNGGEYSKCNKDLNICICTINHLGEDKCLSDSDKYVESCRRQTLYTQPKVCTLECSPKGTIKWMDGEDWYGEVWRPFATFIVDRETSACFDPYRAFNTVPDGFEIKESSIPGIGHGVFANVYVEQDTVIGPYKGVFDPDTESAEESGYSWKIDTRKGEDRANIEWVDAKYIALSNWLRFINTPNSAEMENVVAVQYKGQMYYQVFRSIQPGTELFVWYGEAYGDFLGIPKFDSPRYYYAFPGYAGGSCDEDEEGSHCLFDVYTVCADKTCFCKPGTHIIAGRCFADESLSGFCSGLEGETCQLDDNAVCHRGMCICRNDSIPANGACRKDETYGGRCTQEDGQKCLLDDNTECVHGICQCNYGSSGIGSKCVIDETYGGRCLGEDGAACAKDPNAECWSSICICKDEASFIDGICQLDGLLSGACKDGNCLGENMICDTTSNTCTCLSGHSPNDGQCVKE
ncbi:uncharacterized protein LOC132719568 [Ruditapes philippinarum]|uniref:uncharacterized protein LOC132719568 n=1 Tax=Ruditapes philippinarum TaxID=129788 RepID=UPI00295AB4B3|nr:uncharacterized protein LOC132719568 [Ruditapes philippinarum]